MQNLAASEMTKIIVKLMKIGVKITDNQLDEVAGNCFDNSLANYEEQKKAFINNIHRCLGY